MGRWQPDSAQRLQQAALELYAECGFERATVAEIAERAGVTERTFFRHFADKREVLFAGGAGFLDSMVRGVERAPDQASPLDAVSRGIAAASEMFSPERRQFALQRQLVIEANPELRERELVKLAVLGGLLAGALGRRGVDELTAKVTAEAGVAAFRVAFERWVHDEQGRDFAWFADEAIDALRAVASA